MPGAASAYGYEVHAPLSQEEGQLSTKESSHVSILAVEDDLGVAGLLRELLNDVDGWGATVVPDAAAALATFQQVQIDVLVLDIDLPGISGLDLIKLLHQEDGWHDQPIILVSAQARIPAVREAIKNGVVAEALMKPFDVDHLINVITNVIESK